MKGISGENQRRVESHRAPDWQEIAIRMRFFQAKSGRSIEELATCIEATPDDVLGVLAGRLKNRETVLYNIIAELRLNPSYALFGLGSPFALGSPFLHQSASDASEASRELHPSDAAAAPHLNQTE